MFFLGVYFLLLLLFFCLFVFCFFFVFFFFLGGGGVCSGSFLDMYDFKDQIKDARIRQ